MFNQLLCAAHCYFACLYSAHTHMLNIECIQGRNQASCLHNAKKSVIVLELSPFMILFIQFNVAYNHTIIVQCIFVSSSNLLN